jgi:hypothetical protein
MNDFNGFVVRENKANSKPVPSTSSGQALSAVEWANFESTPKPDEAIFGGDYSS